MREKILLRHLFRIRAGHIRQAIVPIETAQPFFRPLVVNEVEYLVLVRRIRPNRRRQCGKDRKQQE
jgi:hypothetical protein